MGKTCASNAYWPAPLDVQASLFELPPPAGPRAVPHEGRRDLDLPVRSVGRVLGDDPLGLPIYTGLGMIPPFHPQCFSDRDGEWHPLGRCYWCLDEAMLAIEGWGSGFRVVEYPQRHARPITCRWLPGEPQSALTDLGDLAPASRGSQSPSAKPARRRGRACKSSPSPQR